MLFTMAAGGFYAKADLPKCRLASKRYNYKVSKKHLNRRQFGREWISRPTSF